MWDTIPSPDTLSARAYQGLVYSTDIDVGGRTWTIICLATSSIQSSTSKCASTLVLLVLTLCLLADTMLIQSSHG